MWRDRLGWAANARRRSARWSWPMIAIENLVKRHGARKVLHGVSLKARPGRVTGFVGPNSAGKSSTLRCLLGLDRADGELKS